MHPLTASMEMAIASTRFLAPPPVGVRWARNGTGGERWFDGPLSPMRLAPRVREVFIYFASLGMDMACVWLSGR
ncbi:hypothetical protein GCM10011400_50210 [Paraburkholderia caffeinilytica]|uniref:Uncharacterized protein n=1 Tax=Paraburkholderia caffeinilytica TaxID=1761016 RepID=A0ABQ1N7X2_9BURK|nr:hypothetical protein GCM10011400_50210 [Paraburkholderia caffeinilytica]